MGKHIDKKFIERLSILKGRMAKSTFADASGINSVTMLGYLNGSSQPTLEKLRTIAKNNNVTVGWLVDDETVIYRDAPKEQVVNGTGNITAGGRISGTVSSTVSQQGRQHPQLRKDEYLDQDELELITMIRDLGGKRIIAKFKAELLKLQRFLDES